MDDTDYLVEARAHLRVDTMDVTEHLRKSIAFALLDIAESLRSLVELQRPPLKQTLNHL